jgi:MYXO-CTERM domain-containing protein
MKNTILALLLGAVATGVSSAATIAVGRGGATNGYTTFTASGTNLSLTGGFYFSVGTFASEPVITTPASLLNVITNNYSEFASILTPTSGSTIGSLTGSFIATNADFNSVPMYFVVGNGTTRANSTQFAILKGDPTPFVFPASAGSPSGAASITLSGAAVASPLAGAGIELEIAGAPDSLTLVDTIPEPSAVLLGALGALGLLRRRRI